jgi:ABC-2 type transport system ATP-binding protein
VPGAVAAIAKIGEGEPQADEETGVVSVGVGGRGSDALIEAVRGLDGAGVPIRGLTLRRPSLDDVFLALTGHAAEEEDEAGPPGRGRGRRGRKSAGRKSGSATSGSTTAGSTTAGSATSGSANSGSANSGSAKAAS